MLSSDVLSLYLFKSEDVFRFPDNLTKASPFPERLHQGLLKPFLICCLERVAPKGNKVPKPKVSGSCLDPRMAIRNRLNITLHLFARYLLSAV